MKRLLLTIAFFSLVITACGPSNAEIQATVQASIAQTQVAMPTATKIPFSDVDIQGILILPGDLPSNYEAGQIKYDWPTDTGLPMKVKPDNFILQMFKEKGDSFNIPHFSMLAFYDDKQDTDKSYAEIINAFDFQSLTPPVVGDTNSIMHYKTGTDLLTFDATLLVFQRCNSLVAIRVFDLKDDVVFAYAKGLDKRIEKIACK